MTDFFEEWANESEENKRVCAQEDLIINTTEDLLLAMESAHVTKSDLAGLLGKSRPSITQMLSGERNMTLRTLADICFALGLKPSVVLRDAITSSRVNGVDDGLGWALADFQSIPENVSRIRPDEKVSRVKSRKKVVFDKHRAEPEYA